MNQRNSTISVVGGMIAILLLAGITPAWSQSGPSESVKDSVRIARSAKRLADTDRYLELARSVQISRDSYGVPHIEGKTNESLLFGFAYAQAEDFFWQIEDTYILSLGRYSEVCGSRGLNSDLLNRAFEIVPRSKVDYRKLDPDTQSLCKAFAAGLNYYLVTHPEVTPRMINHFEPWHVMAMRRQMTLEMCYRYTRLSEGFLPRTNDRIWAASGSNAWAISGKRTRSGYPMLLANPHLPWFGLAQMYEAHLRSDEGLTFTGATFYGSPMLNIGHNEHLGWTMTVNEPDIADAWRVTFDDPNNRLNYRYAGGYRTAHEWTETIKIKSRRGMKEKKYTFRRTHHGPVVGKEDDQTHIAAQISGLHDTVPLRQALRMANATNFREFKAAVAMLQMPIMNIIYADCAGNIYYLYGGIVPRRDPSFDWTQPVDGSNPDTEWRGVHPLEDLPQLINPPSGFIQNCNSTPFTTTDGDNLTPEAYPPYMIEDRDDDKRRAKRSREILRQMDRITFESFRNAAFDTTIYWARHEIPKLAKHFELIKKTNPTLAREVEPYLSILLQWDFRVTVDSTAASLCEAWYETLYGTEYPGEQIKARFKDNPALQLEALITAAAHLQFMHGSWKVPYGDIHRIQRKANVADLLELRFDDDQPSLPSVAAHGPMGVIYTQYYTPSIHIPLFMSQKKRYGVVGATYLAAYEFRPDGIRGASLVHFGESGEPDSPHFFDQAHLLSQKSLKPILFTRSDVASGAMRTYTPGAQLGSLIED